MEVRQMSTAFLTNENHVLLMKKQSSRLSDRPFWSGLGGHLEPEELNAPMKACYREIHEESGLTAEKIEGLELRYILLRLKENEIRQQFVYFGEAKTRNVTASAEGELHWIHKDAIHDLPMSRIIRLMLEHFEADPDNPFITVGVISVDPNGNPGIQWSAMQDPKVF